MRTIGLIGGMSAESTVPYYQIINRVVGECLGGLHSAEIVLYSVDFEPIERLQRADDWHEAGKLLAAAASVIEGAGADFVALCTNTMHRVAPQIEAAISVPLLHIADPTAQRIRAAGLSRIGLLGTRFTMEQDFYRARLQEQGLDVLIPPEADRNTVHRIIYNELCLGRTSEASRAAYRDVIAGLVDRGAEGVVLGCTEIGLLVGPDDASVPLFDTAAIHAERAATRSLADCIFHLATASELRGGITDRAYTPPSLESEGFIHCAAGIEVALSVAGAYFAAGTEPVLALSLDAERLSSPIEFEPAAPPPDHPAIEHAGATRFPHVYGPLDLTAITGFGELQHTPAGWQWPAKLSAPADLSAIVGMQPSGG